MRSERFYTLLGLFLVTGFLLSFSMLYYFFIQSQARKSETVVMFFDGSLKGLEAGAPVTYRGVKIGHISRIELTEDPRKHTVLIPVYVEFFVAHEYGKKMSPLEHLISKGWSADISKPNLITGIADVEIIKAPGSIKYSKKTYKNYRIFPTVKIPHTELSLDQAIESARQLLNSFRDFINSKDTKNTVVAIQLMAKSFNQLASTFNRQLPSAIGNLNQTLKEISQAAYSTKNAANYFSQYPESLLRGKSAH